MDLQLSVFLLFILFAGGHSLRCYECMSRTGSCADQEVTTCPGQCSVTVVPLFEGNTTKLKIKGCVPSNLCLYTSYSSADVSSFCCNTDLCNAEDSELSGDSSPDIFNISNVPNPPISNGKKCYHCIGESCLNIMDCSGNEDHCIKGTVTMPGQTFAVNGCATKAMCDAITSVSSVGSFSCCDSNLCNGAQSTTMSFTQSSMYNSTQSVTQSSTYSSTQSVTQSSTYSSTQSVTQSSTYNGAQSVNQSSTYNGAQSVNQSSTYNGAQSATMSVTQSFLFLCCSLLSYVLLH